jgi:hypothetical protein
MRQTWRDLLFLHFSCDPEEIQALLPPGLEVDTFPDAHGVERAWVGLVPFLMADVRWSFAPKVPGTHTFPETNVRTYVRHKGKDPGVWFFSLDAANSLAVATARSAFALPYFRSSMSVERNEDVATYAGMRNRGAYRIVARIGEEMPLPAPGSLEFFLVERYLLYAYRRGQFFSGRVFHTPYALRHALLESVSESLVSAAGIVAHPFEHVAYAPGFEVEIFPLRKIF